jgi:alkylation response protein AidB-like acyl-CoA dehydrogenase
MDFSLNDDQKMLRDSVQRFVQGSYDFETRRQKVKTLSGLDTAIWQQFAELGWLALPFSEEDGGIGFGPVETMVLMEELGKGLVVEPFVPTVVLGGGFLRRADTALKETYLGRLIEGDLQLAFAVDEAGRAHGLEGTALSAERQGDGWTLTGDKQCVLNGDLADRLVVLARTSGQSGDTAGLSLFWVDPADDSVTVQAHRTVDGQQAASIRFRGSPAEAVIGDIDQGHELAHTVLNEGILAMAAEAVGALDRLLWDTVEYSKTRKQFGVPISQFQALQHRMANMFMAMEQGRSLLLAATLKTVEGHDDAGQAIHAFKAWLGRGGRLIAQEAIQIHGGMGMTDELSVGHYVKRVTAIDLLFGTADQHLGAYAEKMAG